VAQPTIGGVPMNNDPVVMSPAIPEAGLGATGNPGISGDPTNRSTCGPRPPSGGRGVTGHVLVYRGNKENPSGSRSTLRSVAL